MNVLYTSLRLCPLIRSSLVCRINLLDCYWFTAQPDAWPEPHHLVKSLLDMIIYKQIELYVMKKQLFQRCTGFIVVIRSDWL